MSHFQAWTADKQVFCQDKRINVLEPGMTTEALRGFAYIVVVKNAAGDYIGWHALENNSSSIDVI